MTTKTISSELVEKLNHLYSEYQVNDQKKQDLLLKSITLLHAKVGDPRCEQILDHVIQVGNILILKMNLDEDSLISYLLYVIGLEIQTDGPEIATVFSPTILEIVKGLAKIDKLDTSKYTNQTDNFIKLLLTLSSDLRVILIKLAEKVNQMRNITKIEESLRNRIATETSVLYTPISHRIGLYAIKTELEDLCMEFFHPQIYHDINEKYNNSKDVLEKYISDFVTPLKEKLKTNEVDCEVFGRVKSIPSIWKKMQVQEVPFEKVYDLFAIRIIIDTENEKADCWKVYSLVTEEYIPNPKRMRDWITVPKSSGYESLHATVIGPDGKWVEVQIRTRRMDEIAEKGHASHWRYKDKNSREQLTDLFAEIREALQKPAELKTSASKEKKALYSNEIFIFTPKGDLKKFKAGYTVLDFAYDIHSDIGDTCTGALVNGEMVSFKHILQNGETVKILTSKNQKPNHGWLDFVQSPKSIAKIRQHLKSEEFKYADEGKEIIKHKFEQLHIEFVDVNIQILVAFYKCSNILDLYEMMGEGKLDSTRIKKAMQASEKNETERVATEWTESAPATQSFEDANGDFITVDNQSIAYAYQYSKCCNPVPGDKIFAFISASQGLKIHKTNCKNAKALITDYPYRIIEARWKSTSDDAPQNTQVKITARGGIENVNKIKAFITNDLKLKMQSIGATEESGGNVLFSIALFVNGKDHLNRIISRLKKFQNVKSVAKMENGE